MDAYDDHDTCLGCVACLPLLECRRVPRAEGFTLVAYSRWEDDGSTSSAETEELPELVAEAYGLALPDGQVVTYCESSPGNGSLRVWPDLDNAASHWGAWVVWSQFPNENRMKAVLGRPPRC